MYNNAKFESKYTFSNPIDNSVKIITIMKEKYDEFYNDHKLDEKYKLD